MKKTDTPAFHKLCRLAGQAVGRFRMIADGDRILVGLSGGKDSITLLHVLYAMQKRAPIHFEIFPAVFDPCFPGFGLDILQKYAEEQHWDLHVIRTDVSSALDPEKKNAPCVLCSRIRRGKLAALATELQCTKLALGHHLDDLLISFLMSAARGQGLTTMGPNVRSKSVPSLRLIRPMALAEESLIKEAAAELGPYPDSGRCMYHNELADGDRIYFREMLEKMEKRIPHIRSQLLYSLGKVETGYLLDTRFLED